MREALAALAGFIAFAGYVPYGFDILKGRVKPSRSARFMLTLLLVITLLQQRQLGSGLLVAITYGEVIGTIAILFLSVKNGIGGLAKADLVCYALLAIDMSVWLSTDQTLLALHLSVIADMVAFTPTLLKTWRQPWTETPVYFLSMVIASPLNIIAAGTYRYGVLLFPTYIGVVNLLEAVLIIYRQRIIPAPRRPLVPDHQPLS